MSLIKIDPIELAEKSKGLRQESENFNSSVKAMRRIIDSIPDAWEGEAARAYDAQFSELEPSFQETVELISTIALQMDEAVSAVQELDDEISRKLGVK